MSATDDLPARRTVLYVEDDPVNAMLMQALFEKRPDLRLRVAGSCAAALRCLRVLPRPPALLLLDLRLPDGHGQLLLGQLRALPALRAVPAVAVTAEALDGLDLSDFDELWPKPLRLLQVLERLAHWLPPQPRPNPIQLATAGRAGGAARLARPALRAAMHAD